MTVDRCDDSCRDIDRYQFHRTPGPAATLSCYSFYYGTSSLCYATYTYFFRIVKKKEVVKKTLSFFHDFATAEQWKKSEWCNEDRKWNISSIELLTHSH